MNEVQKLQARLRELRAEAKGLKAQAENDAEAFGDDDEKRLDAVLAEMETVEADIEAAQAKQVRLREKFERAGSGDPRTAETLAQRGTRVYAGRPSGLEVGADLAASQLYRTPREFLLEVIEAGQGRMSERLRPMAAAGSDEQGTYADQYGGFLVPETFLPQLLTTDFDGDPTAGRTQQIPMATPTVRIPARVDKDHSSGSVSGGFTVARRIETAAATASRQSYELISMVANNLFGLAYATEEILTDSAVSFAALLQAGFRDQFASHLLDEKLRGTGVGEFEGILNTPSLVSVAKEGGQSADTIVYENVIKMRARCWGYANAFWLANHDTYPQLAQMSMDIGTGGSAVWQPSVVPDRPDMLLGRPIVFSEYAETLGDKGDLILANWSQYLEGTYQGMQQAASIHVRFLNHEQTFKFWMRNDGRSWWRTALTPRKGASTLSPFVTLDARA
jgi:HK97 family phage major capsid protein